MPVCKDTEADELGLIILPKAMEYYNADSDWSPTFLRFGQWLMEVHLFYDFINKKLGIYCLNFWKRKQPIHKTGNEKLFNRHPYCSRTDPGWYDYPMLTELYTQL